MASVSSKLHRLLILSVSISVEVQPVEEYEDGYTIRVNGYESPFSIILSKERKNDEYPIYSDTTTLSESFFVEYPVCSVLNILH